MSLFDKIKPTWSGLLGKLRSMKTPDFTLIEVADQKDLNAVRNELTRYTGKYKTFSVIFVRD
jgi:hypothetical protein